MTQKFQGWRMLTFFVLLSSALDAQVPGYMGKRTVFGYGVHFHPALAGFTAGYSDSPLHVKHAVFLEHTTSKKAMIGFAVQFYKYIYNNVERMDPGTNYYRYSSYGTRPNGNYEITANNFMVYSKLFFGSYLAPWGRYFTWGVVYTRYTASYQPGTMFIRAENNSGTQVVLSNFGPYKQTYSSADLLIGFGKSRVFADRIIVDWGYHLQAISTLRMMIDFLESGEALQMEEYIKVTSSRRISATNRFNFYLKLGVLF